MNSGELFIGCVLSQTIPDIRNCLDTPQDYWVSDNSSHYLRHNAEQRKKIKQKEALKKQANHLKYIKYKEKKKGCTSPQMPTELTMQVPTEPTNPQMPAEPTHQFPFLKKEIVHLQQWNPKLPTYKTPWTENMILEYEEAKKYRDTACHRRRLNQDHRLISMCKVKGCHNPAVMQTTFWVNSFQGPASVCEAHGKIIQATMEIEPPSLKRRFLSGLSLGELIEQILSFDYDNSGPDEEESFE